MCPHCNKPRRFRTKVLADGTKERICVKMRRIRCKGG